MVYTEMASDPPIPCTSQVVDTQTVHSVSLPIHNDVFSNPLAPSETQAPAEPKFQHSWHDAQHLRMVDYLKSQWEASRDAQLFSSDNTFSSEAIYTKEGVPPSHVAGLLEPKVNTLFNSQMSHKRSGQETGDTSKKVIAEKILGPENNNKFMDISFQSSKYRDQYSLILKDAVNGTYALHKPKTPENLQIPSDNGKAEIEKNYRHKNVSKCPLLSRDIKLSLIKTLAQEKLFAPLKS